MRSTSSTEPIFFQFGAQSRQSDAVARMLDLRKMTERQLG
jgi:hypothetical protein